MSYICKTCNKIVLDAETFGSGKFCSRACANTRKLSEATKQKISNGVLKETKCRCQFCDKEFDTLVSKGSHEKFCSENPDKLSNKGAQALHTAKLNRLYKTARGVELDVTNQYIEDYLDSHTTCEICGRTVEEATLYTGKFAPKRLCVDHDHASNTFRGVLCSFCNKQLGWYETNKDNIEQYLNK